MDYEITYSFLAGPQQTATKRADSRRRAIKKLYLQLGSRYVDIISIEPLVPTNRMVQGSQLLTR